MRKLDLMRVDFVNMQCAYVRELPRPKDPAGSRHSFEQVELAELGKTNEYFVLEDFIYGK